MKVERYQNGALRVHTVSRKEALSMVESLTKQLSGKLTEMDLLEGSSEVFPCSEQGRPDCQVCFMLEPQPKN